MDVFTSEKLSLTENPIFNDATFFFVVAVYELIQVLVFVACVHIYRYRYLHSLYMVDRGISISVDSESHVKNDIRKSTHSVNSYTGKSTINECTEKNEQRLFPLHYERKAVTVQDLGLTDWSSNLKRLTKFKVNFITNDSLKDKSTDSCLRDTNNGLQKGSVLGDLLTEQFRPAVRLTVYPARQHHEQTHRPENDTDSSETTNVTQGEEEENNDLTDGSLQRTTEDRSSTIGDRPVISCDVANDRTEEGTDPIPEDPRADESPEKAPADGSSEVLGIVPQSRYKHPAYELLAERLQTYQRFPNRLQQIDDLANAGFFFNGSRDCTICFCCGGGLEDWGAKDDPWIEHARWFPNCSFVIKNKKQKFVDNVRDALRKVQKACFKELTPHQQRQVIRKQNSELHRRQQYNSATEFNASARLTASQVSSNDLPGNNGVNDGFNLPRYPDLDNFASRFSTFPATYDLDVSHMAEAGFFWKDRDLVICFHCGGHLYDWQPGDNLWIKHARWFPNCQYLEARRGQSFIMDVQSDIEKLVNVEVTNTTLLQYPQRASLQTRRQNNLETSNPQSPQVPRHISRRVRQIDSLDRANEGPSEGHANHELRPSWVQTRPKPISAIAQTQHQPIPISAQIQQQPRPDGAQIQQQSIPDGAQVQQQPIPDGAQVQQQSLPDGAQIQQQPRPDGAQIQQPPFPNFLPAQENQIYLSQTVTVEVQQQPIPDRAQIQQQPRPDGARIQQPPFPNILPAPENQIYLSQTVIVENEQINRSRPIIVSNRNTEQVLLHRTVYAPHVTWITQTGQVVEDYQWDLLCRICQESAAVMKCVPCGHVVFCRRCGRRERVCPVCQRSVDRIEQI